MARLWNDTWTVGFWELSAMIGQKKSFQAIRKVSIASTAMAGRTAGTTIAQKIRKVPAPSMNPASMQLVGHRAGDVLPHEEHAERGDQRRAG